MSYDSLKLTMIKPPISIIRPPNQRIYDIQLVIVIKINEAFPVQNPPLKLAIFFVLGKASIKIKRDPTRKLKGNRRADSLLLKLLN